MNEETFTTRDGTTGYGKDYEYLMAAYYGLICTFNDKILDFNISTNNSDFGDFDDVVVELEFQNNEKHIFALQLKHVTRLIAQINLVNEKGNFSLKKYSEEFKKIRKKYEKQSSCAVPFEHFHFILFTTSNLQKSENFDETWEKLEPVVNEQIVETDVFIKKCEKSFHRDLIEASSETEGAVFRFRSKHQDSPNEQFLQQFSFYTKQKNAKEMERLISETIMKTFEQCDPSVVINYLNYFNFWCRRDYGTTKLTKKDVTLKIAELVLTKFIPEPNLITLNKREKNSPIWNMFLSFDITIIEDQSKDMIEKIWNIALYPFIEVFTMCAFITGWCEPISSLYMKMLPKIPLSACSENFNEMSFKQLYIVLWHSGFVPLVVKIEEESYQVKNICKAIALCVGSKDVQNKFLLLDEKRQFKEESNWKILRTLKDVFTHTQQVYSVIEKTPVSLQGRPYMVLGDLIKNDERVLDTISAKEIVLMLSNPYLIGEDCSKNLPELTIDRMIPKPLFSTTVVDELIIEDLFVISTLDNNNLDTLKTNSVDLDKYFALKEFGYSIKTNEVSSRFYILSKGECPQQKFEEVCSLNQNKNCHHMRLIDKEKIEWIDSKGSLNNLRNFRLEERDFKESDYVKDSDALIYFTNKINLLCADAGMGKTVMMRYFHFICPRNYWVVSVSLREHIKFFKERHSSEEVLEYILTMESKRSTFIRRLADIFVSKKQVVFLWDGFDEIPSECTKSIITTVKDLSDEGYLHWLAARCSSKNFLQEELNTVPLTITQFTSQNQYDYVYHYLKEKYQDERVIEDVINKINENISNTLNCGNFDYTGIPLQLHMLKEIYLKRGSKTNYPLLVTLTDIYQEFIHGKFYNIFERADADLENHCMQEIHDQYIASQMDFYETAAAETVFREHFSLKHHFDYSNFLNEIKETGDYINLIESIDDTKTVYFTHKTYEEFLAASWLSKRWRNYSDLTKLLFDDKYSVIRMMFDMLLARNSPVHLAVLYKNLPLLEKHQEDIEKSKDKAGRNALHLVCSWGKRHPIIKPMEKQEKVEDIEKSREDNYNTFLDIVSSFKMNNIVIPGMEEISLEGSSFDSVNDVLLKIREQTDCTSDLIEHPNAIRINAETLIKVEEEDKTFLNVIQFLLDHKCSVVEKDILFDWNPFQYADHVLCFSALNALAQQNKIQLVTLQNYNHIPTMIHYAVAFCYDNLLEIIEEIPYIEYQYSFGKVTLLQLAADVNSTYGVSKLLQYPWYKQIINVQSAFRGSTINSAAFHGNLEMIDMLLANGAQVNGHLCAAAMTGSVDCCEKLLKAGADINATTWTGESPLWASVITHNFEMVEFLLKNGADVNYVNKNDYAVLECAVGRCSIELLRLLLQYKPNVNRQFGDLKYTSLHMACEMSSVEIVKCLLEHGADTKIKSKMSLTPLHVALYNKQEEIALELIAADPSVVNEYDEDDNDESKYTPVMVATKNNFPNVIRALARYGADMNCDKYDMTPLGIASSLNIDTCLETLIECGASVNIPCSNSDQLYPIHLSTNKLSTVKMLIQNRADVNVQNILNWTPLHFAVLRNNVDVARELLNEGADVNGRINPQKDLKHTPLSHALVNKKLEMMKLLLERGADTGYGSDILISAVYEDYVDGIKLLIEHGVDVNAKGKLSMTPLHTAVALLKYEAIKILLENGADPNLSFELKPSTLTAYTSQMNAETTNHMTYLIDNNKSIYCNPLHFAASQGNILALVSLTSSGASVNSTDSDLETPLHYACSNKVAFDIKTLSNRYSCVKELITRGAPVNHQDKYGQTPLHIICENKDVSVIALLIENGADVNILNNRKQSPLHFICNFGGFENLDLFIQHGGKFDVVDEFGRTPLEYAFDYIINSKKFDLEVLEKLRKLGANLDQRFENTGSTLIHEAAASGQVDLVRYLLENGANTEIKVEDTGYTPLFYACKNNHKKVVALLLEKNCQVNVQEHLGSTPLHLTVVDNHIDIIRMLVNAGSDVNISNVNHFTPLSYACALNHSESIPFLLENNCDVNIQTKDGYTALHYAILHNNAVVVQLLVSAGADINVLNVDHLSPLQMACQRSSYLICSILLHQAEANVNQVNDQGNGLLHLAVSNKNSEVVKLLINNGADINLKNNQCWTPIFYACVSNNFHLIKILQESGADLFIESNTKDSLLSISCEHISVIEYLTKNGLSVHHRNVNGCTPLYEACFHNNYDGALYLIENGAEVDIVTRDEQWTPLNMAVSKGHTEVVILLLFFNADVTKKNSKGYSPLSCAAALNLLEHLKLFFEQLEVGRNGFITKDELRKVWNESFMHAACNGYPRILRFILENELVEINDQFFTNNNYTGLHIACKEGKYDSVLYLLESGAKVDVKAKDELFPIHLAAYNGHLEIIKLLLQYEADIDVASQHGSTPLLIASAMGFIETVKFLCDSGASVDVVDKDGDSPLLEAARNGHLQIVQYLVLKNANVDHKNYDGKTALHLAREHRREEVEEFLKPISHF